jgi:hypothetical protein
MRPLSDLLETSGCVGSGRLHPLAGRRRLRFSFFLDEPRPGVGDQGISNQRPAIENDWRQVLTTDD